MSKSSSSGLTGFENGGAAADLIAEQLQSLQTLRAQGYCTAGQYPWDFWEKRALARGLSKELVALGRAVMREAHQHQWEPRLQQLCGWESGRLGVRHQILTAGVIVQSNNHA